MQYLLTFGVMGSMMPFISVFLAERGLSRTQIGYVTGTAGLGILLSPILVAWLADTSIAGRRLMAVVFVLAGLMIAGLLGAWGFWSILTLYALQGLAFAPVHSLQDGIYFVAQRQREQRGLAVTAYHTVRVFGTIGYIIPSVVLYVLYWILQKQSSVSAALVAGAACCLLGAINSFWLPHNGTAAPSREPAGSRLPTLAAARAMLEPHVAVFCGAMFLVYMASVAYYTFFPLYLTDQLGIEKRWVGLIQTIGVVYEIFFVLGFGYFEKALTLRGVVVVGILAQGLRMALLAAFPTLAVALGVQVLHGLTVLVLHVAPPVYLNRRAGDSYRNSMQGLYAMAIGGVSRIIGSLWAGHLAQASLFWLFLTSAALSLMAAGLVFYAFRDAPGDRLAVADGSAIAGSEAAALAD
jgi:PPP family 3-phenylpropionic acid transporter